MKLDNHKKPQILTLNLTEKANKVLEDNNFNIYKGSLGKLVNTKINDGKGIHFVPKYDIPTNTHEFDILIIDLSNEETIDYNQQNNSNNIDETTFFCKDVIFDSRPYALYLLRSYIVDLIKEESLIIIFQNKNVELLHNIGGGEKKISLYMPVITFEKNKRGLETEIVEYSSNIVDFLAKYNENFTYENIFFKPYVHTNTDSYEDRNFTALVKNSIDEIVSFEYILDRCTLYTFPILKDNSDFILEFLKEVAPTIRPNLFPSAKKWIQEKDYFLPNHQKLLYDKKEITDEFELKIEEKDDEISSNYEEHSFLHNILTETGDNLVLAVIKYLEWLGFINVIDIDTKKETEEKNKTIKEEDIQIENEKGLLVIEVKGIGGTSTDSDCSQISKVKNRRARERKRFDVFGLYIVNHQKHLPALDRNNQPFTENQMHDANYDERGLLTTWQLFNLYFDVQNEIITKEEARASFYEYGLVSFKPKNIVYIGEINEVYKEPKAFILKLDGTLVSKGDTLFIERNEKFQKMKVLEIKLEEELVTKANKGEVGIKGNFLPKEKSKVWIRKDDLKSQRNS